MKLYEKKENAFDILNSINSIILLFTISIVSILVMNGCGSNGGSDVNSDVKVKITSKPITDAVAGNEYKYQLVVNKKSYINVIAPNWLWYEDSDMTLSGVPTINDVGENNITIIATNDNDLNDTYTQEFNIDVKKVNIDLNDKLVFLPSYTIGYKSVEIPIEFIISDYEDISKYTIVFTRSVDGNALSYEFGSALIDISHNVAFIKANVYIPENESIDAINHTISAIYMNNGIDELIYAVNIKQEAFVPETVVHEISVDMTNANGGYTLTTDQDGKVQITPNASFMKDSCEAQGWIWNQAAMVCVPTPSEPEYQDVLDCINNPVPPNKWSFDLHACYSEIEPEVNLEDICTMLSLDYNSTTQKCY